MLVTALHVAKHPTHKMKHRTERWLDNQRARSTIICMLSALTIARHQHCSSPTNANRFRVSLASSSLLVPFFLYTHKYSKICLLKWCGHHHHRQQLSLRLPGAWTEPCFILSGFACLVNYPSSDDNNVGGDFFLFAINSSASACAANDSDNDQS